MTELPKSRPPAVADGPDSHLFTRPMRLGDVGHGGIPAPRLPRRDGRLSGV